MVYQAIISVNYGMGECKHVGKGILALSHLMTS